MATRIAWRLLVALSLALGGCSSLQPQPTIAGDPLPGSIHLISDPRRAPRDMSIRLDDRGGPSSVSDDFTTGTPIVVDRSTLPGDGLWIEADGSDCEGRFTVVERVEIDLLLTIEDDICRVTILGSHPDGAVRHGDEPASLGLRVPLGSRVRLHRLDPDAAIPDRTVDADESGSISLDVVAPGRYEVVLVVNRADARTVELDLAPGDDAFLDLTGP